MPRIIVKTPGPAVVVKLAKRGREVQRWRAECPECPTADRLSFGGPASGHWTGYASRRGLTAKYDAERHNATVHHPKTEQESETPMTDNLDEEAAALGRAARALSFLQEAVPIIAETVGDPHEEIGYVGPEHPLSGVKGILLTMENDEVVEVAVQAIVQLVLSQVVIQNGREAFSTEQFTAAIEAERARQRAKGYTPERDAAAGVDHLLSWAIDYGRRGEAVQAAALVQAARDLLVGGLGS